MKKRSNFKLKGLLIVFALSFILALPQVSLSAYIDVSVGSGDKITFPSSTSFTASAEIFTCIGTDTPNYDGVETPYAGTLNLNASNVAYVTGLYGVTYFTATGTVTTTGNFNGASTETITGNITGGTFNIATHTLTINITNITGVAVSGGIESYYGLNAPSYEGALTLYFDPKFGKISGGDLNVNAVPIPAAAWLLGSGLVGLLGIRRKMRS